VTGVAHKNLRRRPADRPPRHRSQRPHQDTAPGSVDSRGRSRHKRGPHLYGKCMRAVPLGEGVGRFLESVGDRIRAIRIENEVSVDELAAACGVHKATVHGWESNYGRRAITLSRIVQVAKALGVLPLDLMPTGDT
jgi:DNA-binding XRE family transcriptional regulator